MVSIVMQTFVGIDTWHGGDTYGLC